MAAGDIILSDGTTITPEDLQRIAAAVTELINTNAKDPGQWELAESLEGVTSLPVFQVIGSTYKLVRVAVEILKGVDGKEVELMANQDKTYIQWRYTDGMWNNLIAIADLKGDSGETPEFRKGETGVEWKYKSESEWKTLIPFSELKWNFSDLTPEQIEQLWENLPENILTEFKKPATEAAVVANAAAESANNAAGLATSAANKATEETAKATAATEAANTATSKTKAATERAIQATTNADNATQAAQSATSLANEATDKANIATSNADTATANTNEAITNANTATDKANQATENANAAAQRANKAAQAAEEAVSTIRPDWLAGKESGNYIKNKPEIPTLASAPTEDTLTYINTDGTQVSYKIGDLVRFFDKEDAEDYVFYQLYDIADGKAKWKLGGSGDVREKVRINLSSNQAQPDNALNGLIIHVKYGDNDTSPTWNGAPMTTEIPMNMTYTIEYPVLAGYASPANEEYIALAGNTRQVEASYNTTILMINVSSNQEDKSDLNNVQITLSGSISKILDYNGSPLSVNVPTGKQLVITPSQIEGYAVVQAVTKTPAASSESVSFMYNTTVMSITLTSNQGTDAALNAGTNVTIKCGTVNKTLTWRGSVLAQKIPTEQPYTLTPATLSGYKTPAAKTGTASGANMSESMQYLTELLTVTVNTDNSVSCSGQKVTINGTVHTYNSPISVKIPFGTSYSISVNGKAGFTSPENKSFTANQASRSVTMTYLEIKRGIFILDTDGNLVKRSEWSTSNNSKAVGVAVLSDNCKFVIAPTQNSDSPYWSKGGAYDSVSGVTTTTNSSVAKTDYKGVSNSSAIVSKYGASTDYAAGWCQNFSFKNGKKGYLGSCGEWQEAYNNKAEIDACMSLIGGTAIATDDYHWTSTQYGSSLAWLLNWSGGHVDDYYKNNNYRVRAFAAL